MAYYVRTMSSPRKRGVSKAQWLEAGMEHLSKKSVNALSIEDLAGNLGIAKSGFYWHFKNRDSFLEELLQYWIHEITEVVTANEQVLALEPRARLLKTAEMIFDYDLTRWELAIREWGRENTQVASAVRKANKMRMNYILDIFHELGFEGEDAKMRAMTFVTHMTWDMHTFGYVSRKERRAMIKPRIDLLIS
jgi:AcrR family transcriptional regulator